MLASASCFAAEDKQAPFVFYVLPHTFGYEVFSWQPNAQCTYSTPSGCLFISARPYTSRVHILSWHPLDLTATDTLSAHTLPSHSSATHSNIPS
ncbi:hypothetical protein [Rubritalea tangerina]|uniref:hypothetical protein n=1 Tax=Rubritalea tangerina TaxID=430798 RepID=UPI003611BE3F